MRVTEPREKYLNDVFGLPDADLARVRERMLTTGREGMSIASNEARILQFLVRAFAVRKVVEFGTFYGYSALAMAKALPEGGVIYTLEKDPEHHKAAALTFASVSSKVKSLCGEASDLMRSIEREAPFDMVFIDANKSGYLDYLEWSDKNVRPGGLIVGDNTFLWGGVWDEAKAGEKQAQVMREFNRRLADSSKYNSILIPTAEGLTVAQKL